jgi:RNA polymerase sigma factor (sigma-70 family)
LHLPDLATYTDEILVEMLANGDQQVFTEIYNRYWQKLYYVAYSRLRVDTMAEEIVQEVFMTLWRKRGQLNIQSLSLYLAAMARHEVYRQLAREKKKQTAELNAVKQGPSGINPDDAYDSKSMMEIVGKLTNVLPEKCRLVFIQNKLLDQPLDVVAGQMNISLKTAEAHITKALKIVRSKLGESLMSLILL